MEIQEAAAFLRSQMTRTGVVHIDEILAWLSGQGAFELRHLEGWTELPEAAQLVHLLSCGELEPGFLRGAFTFIASVSPVAELKRVRQILKLEGQEPWNLD